MLKRTKKSSRFNNEKGMAVFEMIPIIVVIVLFVNFSIGFFGAIHTGILNSIAARNYAFETFRNRSNLNYFRNNVGLSSTNSKVNYVDMQFRTHAIASDKKAGTSTWFATTRLIDFMNTSKRAADVVGNTSAEHNRSVRGLRETRNETVGVNPIWLRTVYGICLKSQCGESGS